MTVPLETRSADIRKTLMMMADTVGDDYCYAWLFPVKDHPDVLTTTWRELEDAGLIKARHTFGNPQYELTASGWLEGLIVSGRLGEAALRGRAVRLAQALKAVVAGRKEVYDALADERQIAESTGLPVGWIHNAVQAGLLQEVFPKDMMNVYLDAHGRHRRVPPTFGMDWLE